jgi:carboxynorspermidine decarboxylase
LAGASCLAGDVIGDWSFARPLAAGDRLAFLDMAHYTMVKTTTFNGIQHPHLCTFEPRTGELTVVRSFTYEDFRSRLS